MRLHRICYLSLLLLQTLPFAWAVPKGLVISDDTVGATCENYLLMGKFPWEKPMGDWVDKAGTLYGNQPYATQDVKAQQGRQLIEFNVTPLVEQWLSASQPNQGMLLRSLPGPLSGVVEFLSKESPDLSGRPMLKLQWKDGSRSRLSPAADTFLDCTSLSSLGSRPEIKVSTKQNALLRFDLPPTKGSLQEATLYLASNVQYGSGGKIGVFRVQTPFERASNEVQQGLAHKYPRDQGIEKDPDVVFAHGFESKLWMTEWSDWSLRSEASAVEEDSQRLFVPLSGKALRVTLLKGKNLGLDLRYQFAKDGKPEPEEIFFRYYLRFADDWNPSLDGGKMPGISGTYGRAGWGMRKTDGYNGWSARGGFFARPAEAKHMRNLTALNSYSYHADIHDASGDIWAWGKGPAALLENNRWYAVEQYLKLNTPGIKDGVMRAWINGKLVMDKTNIRFRNTPELKIETIWLDVYHGGISPSPHDMSLYIDNVVIARKYIGPLKP